MAKQAASPEPLRIAADATRQRIFIVIGAVVAAASLFVFLTGLGSYGEAPWRVWASAAGIVVGSACALIFMRMLPEHRYALEVDERGISDFSSSVSPGLIAWDDIAAVYDWQVRQAHTLAIDLKDPEGFQERVGVHPAANVRARLAQGIPAIEVRVAAFPGSYTVDEVLEAARAWSPRSVNAPRRWSAPKK